MRQRRRGFTLIELMVVIVIIAVLAAIMTPNFMRSRGQGRVSACKSNLRNLATALESYVLDNGRLPTTLDALPSSHINSLPICPGSGTDTYSAGYEFSSTPMAFTLVCSGENHSAVAVPPNFPQYVSSQGTIER